MTYAQAFFLYATSLKIADALVVYAAWHVTWTVRFQSSWIPFPKGLPDFTGYAGVSFPLVLVFSVVLHIVGTYRSDRIPFGFRPVKKLIQGSLLGTLVFVAVLYFAREIHVSRAYLTVFCGVVAAGLVVERALLHLVWKTLQPLIRRLRILVVGYGPLLEMYVEKLRHVSPYPIEWVGQLTDQGQGPTLRWLGDENRLPQVLAGEEVDGVVLSYPPSGTQRYAPLLHSLSKELVDVKVVPDFGRESTFSYHAEQECGVPLLAFNRARTSMTDRVFKRTIDVLGSMALLIVFSPVFLLLGILVKLTSRGPVFYGQERVGADGRRFTLYKFRSMRTDAEASTGPVWARRGDDRTTGLGRWMRRTSLDEIPQFYNVLRGDMSLVGPRPERPMFVDQFKEEIPRYMLRHKMKSGITGWAQVNGWRGDTSLEERIRHDLYYIGHWSHRFDFKILVLTVVKGFTHRNAY